MECPIPKTIFNSIQMGHGGGGKMTQQLIADIFYKEFDNALLRQQHDGAVCDFPNGKLAFSTDSFVVNPIFFNGGDIGDLAVNGTINDLACCGAKPLYLSVGFILEEGFALKDLKRICVSMKRAAEKAGVSIVTGDTKVVDRGKCDKIYINTSGVGVVNSDRTIHANQVLKGDQIIVTGSIGNHGICILSTRESLGFETTIQSDTASLNKMLSQLISEVEVHVMRDPTRGGLASTLNEIAASANVKIELSESNIPIEHGVSAACDLLGLDPLGVANEGIVVLFVPAAAVDKTLAILQSFPEGKQATLIGEVLDDACEGEVILRTITGTTRLVEMISGEQLPRIC